MSHVKMQYVAEDEIQRLKIQLECRALELKLEESKYNFECTRKTVLRNVINVFPHQGVSSILKSIALLGDEGAKYQTSLNEYNEFTTKYRELLK